jgi:hypothetical protein
VDRPVLGSVATAGEHLTKAVREDVWRLQEPELGAVLAGLEAVRRDTERLLVAVVGEALSRGVHHTQGFSSGVDYVRHHTPSLEPVEAHQLVQVAVASREARHAPVAAAVAAGTVSVRRAAAVLRAMEQVRPFVDAGQYLADQDIVLPVAVGGSEKDLRAVVRHLVECARPQRDSDAFEAAQRRARGLSVRPGPGGADRLHLAVGPRRRRVRPRRHRPPGQAATRRGRGGPPVPGATPLRRPPGSPAPGHGLPRGRTHHGPRQGRDHLLLRPAGRPGERPGPHPDRATAHPQDHRPHRVRGRPDRRRPRIRRGGPGPGAGGPASRPRRNA